MKITQRSKQAESIIKDKLSKFFTDEQLDLLDDLGIEVLSDQFSDSDLRDLQSAPSSLIKSFVDKKQTTEVRRRLTCIHPDEIEMLMPWYKENCSEIEEVIDPQTETVIALEVKHKTLNNRPNIHWDGRFIIGIGDRLLSTRSRLDGVVGYQSNVQVKSEDEPEELLAYRIEVERINEKNDKKLQAAAEKYFAKVNKEEQAYRKKHPEWEDLKDFVPSEFQQPKLDEYPEPPVLEGAPEPTDSRWSDIEIELIPEEHVMSSLSSSDIVKVRKHIEDNGIKKPVRKIKEGYKVDKFILKKVK